MKQSNATPPMAWKKTTVQLGELSSEYSGAEKGSILVLGRAGQGSNVWDWRSRHNTANTSIPQLIYCRPPLVTSDTGLSHLYSPHPPSLVDRGGNS